MSLTPLVHLDASLEGLRPGGAVALDDAAAHHLRRVLRLPAGAEVEVSDGRGGHATATLDPSGALHLVQAPTHTPAPRPALAVAQALPKGRKMDEIVRVGVELGLDRLVPVAAERCVSRPTGQRAEKAVQRWRAVARAACEQARRRHRPEIATIVTPDALAVDGSWLVAHPDARESLPATLTALGACDPDGGPDALTVAVGPEGGWTDAEVAALVDAGARPVRLGSTVLRTEHAAAAALAVCAALNGRWG